MADVSSCSFRPKTCTWAGVALNSATDFNFNVSAGSEVRFDPEAAASATLKLVASDFLWDFSLGTNDLALGLLFDCEAAAAYQLGVSAALVVVGTDLFNISATNTYTCAAGVVNGYNATIGRGAPGSITITGKALFGASGAAPIIET